MPLPAYRAKQSTTTTGTGTLILAAASATGRSLAAAFGAARQVQYVISWATGFEIGWGAYDGASPGSLTRATVLASSNAGALVSLPAGVKDVFVAWLPRQAENTFFTATATLAAADLGGLVVFGGGTAATLNLPAFAGVPLGASFLLLHQGVGTLTIDPAGAETINGATTLQVFAGETAEIFRTASGWTCAELGNAWRQIGASVSASAQGALVFGLPANFSRFRLEIEDCSPTAAAFAFLRYSFDGGTNYAAGASDYTTVGTVDRLAGTAPFYAAQTVLQVSDALVIGGDMFGSVEFRAQGGKRATFQTTGVNANGLTSYVGGGICAVAGTATHVLFGFGSTTIQTHRSRLLAIA